MPTAYNGKPGDVSFSSNASISSSTIGPPISITISGTLPATAQTGTLVDITGHTTNTHANGIHAITVTGASTFTIPVTGNGVGGANGTVVFLSSVPSSNIPNDGESCNQASVIEEMGNAADRTAMLLSMTGQYKLASYGIPGTSIGGTTAGSAIGGSLPPTAWAINSSTGSGFFQMQDPGSSTPINWILGGLVTGDVVVLSLDGSAQIIGTGATDYTGIVTIAYQLTPWISGGSFVDTLSSPSPGMGQVISTHGSSETSIYPVNLRTIISGFSFSDSSSAGMVYFAPYANVNGSASETVKLVGDYIWSWQLWRPTSAPQ